MIHEEYGVKEVRLVRKVFREEGIEYPSFLLSFSSFSDLPLSYEAEISVEEKEMRLVAQFTKRNRC